MKSSQKYILILILHKMLNKNHEIIKNARKMYRNSKIFHISHLNYFFANFVFECFAFLCNFLVNDILFENK